jgi:hypothetical protein
MAIGSYFVHYASGAQVEIPLLYGEDLRSWVFAAEKARELTRGSVAWTGRTTGVYLRPVRLFKLSWDNPHPEQEVASLDFESAGAESAPFLIAVTAE